MQEGEDKGGGLLLYFKTGLSPSSWVTHVMNLSQPSSLRTLHDKDGLARGPVRTSILVLSNGDWLAASSHEVNVPMVRQYPPPVIWDAFVDRSTDCGETWERSPFIPYDRKRFGEYGGVIQPVMWESTPGNIHMLLRSTIGHICRSDSSDYGKTWSPITATALPNNNSGIDVVKNPMTGVVALVYNPVGDNWGARSPLSVAFSSGEGRDWSAPVNIEEGWGSFSYPSIRPSGEGFALTYTWNRLRIACTEFQVDPKDFQTDIEVAVNLKPSSV
jgi:predicted neuraminidase